MCVCVCVCVCVCGNRGVVKSTIKTCFFFMFVISLIPFSLKKK